MVDLPLLAARFCFVRLRRARNRSSCRRFPHLLLGVNSARGTARSRRVGPHRAGARRDSRSSDNRRGSAANGSQSVRTVVIIWPRPVVYNLSRYMRYERSAIGDVERPRRGAARRWHLRAPRKASQHTASRPATRFRPDLPAVSQTKCSSPAKRLDLTRPRRAARRAARLT
jgi:hypothetical protein